MYGVNDKYLKLQEYPFSSEQKLMAVKCVHKYDDVIISNINFFFFLYFYFCYLNLNSNL